ncbi:Wadjet anti-phage system protein JetD domain-containing protein [Roseburia hominis]
MKRVSLDQLLYFKKDLLYIEQYEYVMLLLKEGHIRPLKASGTNGKHPALYREYWLLEESKDYSVMEDELKYQITPQISVDYYLSHLEAYEQDRDWVLKLSEYLKDRSECLESPESVNERSFEIWGREKFLSKEQGRKILKRCGLTEGFLNIYKTVEPLAYYSHTREVPQNLLILENKDTFYSMRRHLLEGNDRILGVRIGTLIYGGGKRIRRSFEDFEFCIEPYMKADGNRIYYFGDMDYEGIGIYEGLAEVFAEKWKIEPFVPAYEALLRKAKKAGHLPETKEQQNRNIKNVFFLFFSEEQTQQMKKILECNEYVPQEILNISDFS